MEFFMDIPSQAYGSWQSKITAEMVATKSVKLSFSEMDKDFIYYEEIRPDEQGRSVIIKQKFNKKPVDLLPKEYNARTKVHEYGGKSFFVNDSDVYFVNFNDQKIYKIDQQLRISPITEGENFRYGDIIFDKKKNHIYCVQEEHEKNNVINSVIKIDLKTNAKTTIAKGHDFYASLTISPDSKKLAFIAWDHPNMPWDGTYLMVYNIEKKTTETLAGSDNESIFQPSFGPDDYLYFVSDRSNFWNLYRINGSVEPVFPMEAEMGEPLWQLGYTSYAFVKKKDKLFVYCIYTKNGKDYLAEIDLKEKKIKSLNLPFSFYNNLRSFEDKLICLAASPTDENCLILIDANSFKYEVVKRSRDLNLEKEYISIPEPIEFLSNNKKVFAFYYPPKNPNFVGPSDDLPPLIVKSHGGPTAQSKAELKLEMQYWTSRGFACVDVNYSGSSGYGREYRLSLNGNWGVLDVEDCINAALYLVKNKKAHPKRLIVRGSSAGGYTTLASLAFKKVFSAGASYFGVSDLESLARDMLKFESHYLDKLIGPYPERKDLYFARSPINFADHFSCPVILLQGKEDAVVPKEQAEIMYRALLKNKIPCAYLLFENEQHGFRDAKNIKRALEAEHYFYSKVLGFKLLDKITPIKIDNL